MLKYFCFNFSDKNNIKTKYERFLDVTLRYEFITSVNLGDMQPHPRTSLNTTLRMAIKYELVL